MEYNNVIIIEYIHVQWFFKLEKKNRVGLVLLDCCIVAVSTLKHT